MQSLIIRMCGFPFNFIIVGEHALYDFEFLNICWDLFFGSAYSLCALEKFVYAY